MASDVPATSAAQEAAAQQPCSNTASPPAPVTEDVKPDRPVNDNPPSASELHKVENHDVLDNEGKSHPFKSIYGGPDCTKRVLVIFIRHFFCGNCQEYIRAIAQTLKPDDLCQLPHSTSIVVIGCGDPGLIDHYVKETGCPFPIYTDPTRKLYDDLGMIMSLAMGARPGYFRRSMLGSVATSIVQGLRHVSSGLATKSGDSRQNGGEFLFDDGAEGKVITWCHRMTNTRDHTEIPELVDVLDPEGKILQKTH